MKKRITQKRLKELVHYNPKTGAFVRLGMRTGPKTEGNRAGTAGGPRKAYLSFRVGNISYKAHHLAWLYVYGRLPTKSLDHVDGNGHNNAIENLREATRSQNGGNRKRNKRSRSKYKGVAPVTRSSSWQASIQANKKQQYLGCFPSQEEAARAYDAAAKKLFGEFARVNFP